VVGGWLTQCNPFLVGFGTIVNVLGQRTKPYLPQICGILLWRLNNKSAKGA
jgi:splicing factor 3B subunit 1